MDIEDYLKQKKTLEAKKELLEAKEKLKDDGDKEVRKEKIKVNSPNTSVPRHEVRDHDGRDEGEDKKEPVLKPWMLWNVIILVIVVGLFSVTYYFPKIGIDDIQSAVEQALEKSSPVTGQVVAETETQKVSADQNDNVENQALKEKLDDLKDVLEDLEKSFSDLLETDGDKISDIDANEISGLINDAKKEIDDKNDLKAGIIVLDIKDALNKLKDKVEELSQKLYAAPEFVLTVSDDETGEFDDNGKVDGKILFQNGTEKFYSDFKMTLLNKEKNRIRCFMDYNEEIDTNKDGDVDLTYQKLNYRILELDAAESDDEGGFSVPANHDYQGNGDVTAYYKTRCYFCLNTECDHKEDELKKTGDANQIIKKIRIIINSFIA